MRGEKQDQKQEYLEEGLRTRASTKRRADQPGPGEVGRGSGSRNYEKPRQSPGRCKNSCKSKEKGSNAKPCQGPQKRLRGSPPPFLGTGQGRTPLSSQCSPGPWGRLTDSVHPAPWGLMVVCPQQNLHWEGKEGLKHDSVVETVALQLKEGGKKNIFNKQELLFYTDIPGTGFSDFFVCFLSVCYLEHNHALSRMIGGKQKKSPLAELGRKSNL